MTQDIFIPSPLAEKLMEEAEQRGNQRIKKRSRGSEGEGSFLMRRRTLMVGWLDIKDRMWDNIP